MEAAVEAVLLAGTQVEERETSPGTGVPMVDPGRDAIGSDPAGKDLRVDVCAPKSWAGVAAKSRVIRIRKPSGRPRSGPSGS